MRVLARGSAVLLILLLAAAAPASGGRVLEVVTASGVTGTATYDETNGGIAKGSAISGIVGHGVFTTRATPTAEAAAALLGAVKGIPIAALLNGGSYVTRYGIDGKNAYSGLVVATFKHRLGSLCIKITIAHGKFSPSKSFIPANGTMTAVGGTGKLAKLHGTVHFTQSDVTGANVETFTERGMLRSVRSGAAAPMSAACKAVARLAHT
jgi:hypothetical protein